MEVYQGKNGWRQYELWLWSTKKPLNIVWEFGMGWVLRVPHRKWPCACRQGPILSFTMGTPPITIKSIPLDKQRTYRVGSTYCTKLIVPKIDLYIYRHYLPTENFSYYFKFLNQLTLFLPHSIIKSTNPKSEPPKNRPRLPPISPRRQVQSHRRYSLSYVKAKESKARWMTHSESPSVPM